MLNRRTCLWLALATLAFATLKPTTAFAQPRALFSDDEATSGAARNRAVTSEPTVVRSRRATADLSLLAAPGVSSARGFGQAAQPAARSIALNLFSDVDLIAQLDRVELVQPLGYAWVGQIAGVDGSDVVLAVADGILTGSIALPSTLYSVRRVDQSYVVAEIDRRQIPGDEVPPPIGDKRPADETTAAADTGDTFDLLLYYTTGVKNAAGGVGAVNSLITASIARVNSTYLSSNISTQVRLVAALETPYVDSGNTATDLPALRNDPGVRAARDQYGADLVSMLVTRDPAASGRGYVSVSQGTPSADLGYNVVVYYSYIGYIYALAHEIGHNQGCLHEPGNNNGDDTSGAFLYSLGYTDFTNRFHDIMSYGLGCTGCADANQFSSPVDLYQGHPVGTPLQDNARTINNTRVSVANYRVSLPAVTLSAPTGLTASSFGSSVTPALTAPSSGTPTAYTIEAGSASGLANLASSSTGNTATTFGASGVGAAAYYERVRATDGSTTSAASNEATLVGGGGCAGPPPAPSGFTLTGNSGGTASFSWGAAPTATTYVIGAGSAPGTTDIIANADLASGATTATFNGVGRGTYYVRLLARNICGTRGPSNEVALIVP